MSDFHLDLNPLKEPLGLIKLLEWFFSIFVFATCGGYKGVTTVLVSCNGLVNRTVTASFAYPFRLNKVTFSSPDPTQCNGSWGEVHLVGNFASSAQFIVTFAVIIFLYCMAALVLYLGYMHMYRNGGKIPMIDYVFSLCAFFLWLVSSAAWAKALVDIKVSTGPHIVEEIPACKMPGSFCIFGSVTSMGSLNVSVVFGLVNMILWAGNAWFVYKETSLHKPNSNSPGSGLYPPASGI
ncbi:synaptophysin-like protein 1 [Hemicordylus capensis]|uniref:synaptophysin-like protein 1 n=1 Tax=Hemicordylus capensis TaxID=884348 RepID=UPI002302AEAB|nr:synaptophysin-like protein 1 [Hemicordylus capensis]XP_053114559.1 synaptophysin-like protein 1 [Hemicordylus capensis]XP_053114560.1 synaptophysin-like protein 1 [Hemicordylus capensis]